MMFTALASFAELTKMNNFQVIFKPDENSSDTPAELKAHLPNLVGQMEEEKLFDKLRSTLEKADLKDTVVINGWKDNGYNKATKREYDFLIISKEHQSIFHIEVKKSFTDANFKKAADQLQDGFEFISSRVPFSTNSGKWRYIRIMYFGILNSPRTLTTCSDCSHLFILHHETNISDWWKEITTKLNQENTAPSVEGQTESSETYLDIIKFLLHQG
jgi:hypothetical protein